MLHDAGRAFGTKHTLIDRMIPVALDVPDFGNPVFPALHVNVYSASAGTHIARCLVHLVANWGVEIKFTVSIIHIKFPAHISANAIGQIALCTGVFWSSLYFR